MSDEEKTQPVTLNGYQRTLSSGAKVWMAKIPIEHGNGFALHFTSTTGEPTKLCLSVEAMLAIFSLHESLSEPESMSYRLLVTFAEKLGDMAKSEIESTWTKVLPEDETKEPSP